MDSPLLCRSALAESVDVQNDFRAKHRCFCIRCVNNPLVDAPGVYPHRFCNLLYIHTRAYFLLATQVDEALSPRDEDVSLIPHKLSYIILGQFDISSLILWKN